MKIWVILKKYDWDIYGSGTEVYAVVDSETKMIEVIKKEEAKNNIDSLYSYFYEAVEMEVG